MSTFKRQREWARELGVSPITLRRAVQRGDLAVTRVGNIPLHSETQIAQWLDAHTKPAIRRGGDR